MGIPEVANGCQKLPYVGESHLFVVGMGWGGGGCQVTCWRDTYKGRVFPPDVSEFSSLFPQPFENIRIGAVNLHTSAVHLPLFFQLFFFIPNPIMAPKHHQLLVELEDEIEGSGVRPQLMTPPSDPHHSQPLSSDLPLRSLLEEPSPKPPTPLEWLKKSKQGKQLK